MGSCQSCLRPRRASDAGETSPLLRPAPGYDAVASKQQEDLAQIVQATQAKFISVGTVGQPEADAGSAPIDALRDQLGEWTVPQVSDEGPSGEAPQFESVDLLEEF